MELLTSNIRRKQDRSPAGDTVPQLRSYSPSFGATWYKNSGASPGVFLSVVEPIARSIPDEGHGQGCCPSE